MIATTRTEGIRAALSGLWRRCLDAVKAFRHDFQDQAGWGGGGEEERGGDWMRLRFWSVHWTLHFMSMTTIIILHSIVSVRDDTLYIQLHVHQHHTSSYASHNGAVTTLNALLFAMPQTHSPSIFDSTSNNAAMPPVALFDTSTTAPASLPHLPSNIPPDAIQAPEVTRPRPRQHRRHANRLQRTRCLAEHSCARYIHRRVHIRRLCAE
jgi:hypothetical protein